MRRIDESQNELNMLIEYRKVIQFSENEILLLGKRIENRYAHLHGIHFCKDPSITESTI